jgi:hypothetical protein
MFKSSLIFLLLSAAISCSDSASQVSTTAAPLAEFNVDLDRKNFSTWFDQGYPTFDELRWRLLGWEQHVTPAFDLSRVARKPLMIWLEDGHPLGATSEHGRALREAFSDDSLAPILNKYVVAVDDFNRTPAVIDSIAGELVVFTSSGAIVGRSAATDVPTIINFLTTALDNFNHLPTSEQGAKIDPSLLEGAMHIEDDFPDDGLSLEVFTRAANSLDLSTIKRNPWLKDYVWFNQNEILEFVKPIKISGEKSLPKHLLNRLVSHCLVPPYNGAPNSWREDSILESHVVLKCNSVIKNRSTYLIHGSAHCEQDGKVLNVRLRGAASYDTARDQFGLLEIIALAEYIDGDTAPQLFTTAMRKVTSIDKWHRVPPKALSDYADAYFSLSGSGNPNK